MPLRESHIKRIFGKTRNPGGGEPTDNFDLYADMLRVDVWPAVAHSGAQEQALHLNWLDGPDDPPEGNSSRKTTILKLTDPENPPDDPDDPDDYIPVPVIDALQTKENGQVVTYHFHNRIDPDNPAATTRKVKLKRVTHFETNLDELPIEEQKKPVKISPDNDTAYIKKPGTEDEGQYLDVEFIETHEAKNSDAGDPRFQSAADPTQIGIITEAYSWNNRDLADPKKYANAPRFDEDGAPTKRNRFDPFQIPVNVQWGKGPRDLMIVGIDGDMGNYMTLGVRNGTVKLVDSGDHIADNPPDYGGERVTDNGVETGEATIEEGFRLRGDAPTPVKVDITGGRGKRPDEDLSWIANGDAGNGDYTVGTFSSVELFEGGTPGFFTVNYISRLDYFDRNDKLLWSKDYTYYAQPFPVPFFYEVGFSGFEAANQLAGIGGWVEGGGKTFLVTVETSQASGGTCVLFEQEDPEHFHHFAISQIPNAQFQNFHINVYDRAGALVESFNWGTNNMSGAVLTPPVGDNVRPGWEPVDGEQHLPLGALQLRPLKA